MQVQLKFYYIISIAAYTYMQTLRVSSAVLLQVVRESKFQIFVDIHVN